MIAKTLSLILLTSFAPCLHGMVREEKISEIFTKSPVVVGESPQLLNVKAATINNEHVAAQDRGTMRLFSPSTGEALNTKFEHPKLVMRAALSPCGKLLATAALDEFVRLWSTQSGKCVAQCRVSTIDPQDSLVFSPNSSQVAFLSWFGNGVFIWKTAQPSEPATEITSPLFSGPGVFVSENTFAYVQDLIFDNRPDESSVCLVDIGTKKQLAEMLCGCAVIDCITQAPSKPHLIAAQADDEIWFWNTQGKPPSQPLLNRPKAKSVGLSSGGRFLSIGTNFRDHALNLYEITADASLPALAKATFLHRMQFWPTSPITRICWAMDNSSLLLINGSGCPITCKPSDEFQKMLDSEKQSEEKEEEEIHQSEKPN